MTCAYVFYSFGNKICWTTFSQLVCRSLRFIYTAIRSGQYKELFGVKQTISTLVQGVVVPNVGLRGTVITIATHHVSRIAHDAPFSPEHEMKQSEDNPFEYVRLNLSLPSISLGGADNIIRRQAGRAPSLALDTKAT